MSENVERGENASTSTQTRLPAQIDISKQYRISHILEGHSSDVRALSYFEQIDGMERIQSASRDETVRSWIRPIPKASGIAPPPTWYEWITLHGKRYQNAVASLNLNEDEGLTVMGGLDARILVYKFKFFDDEKKLKELDEPIQIIQEHHDNVCHLSISSQDRTPKDAPRLLISASWDATARVYALLPDAKIGHKWKSLHFLKGHERSVLEAQIVSAEPGNEHYLTVSADLTIRYWHAEKVIKTFTGHVDVIRSIALLPVNASNVPSESKPFKNQKELFATCSNDGTIKLWSLDDAEGENTSSSDTSLATLIPKKEDGTPMLDLVFSVRFAGIDANGDRLLVSGGEGGRVYIWNIDTQKEILQILQPVTTCWDVLFLPSSGDIVTADSDNKIRVYTQRVLNTGFMASEHRFQQKERGLQVELNKEEIQKYNEQCDQLAQSRVRADIIATEAGQQEDIFDGQHYDAVLKIDVSDDSEPLSLPINKGDDPRTKAKAFIQQYSLSERYEDDIVAFIQQVGPK